ncbi:Uncharacterised protein [Vibrio cholerae]|nr:Uncharacterised protein [Vibrio cholerae]CSD43992.1 Uncharacterised protein [Vibrio cholerae]
MLYLIHHFIGNLRDKGWRDFYTIRFLEVRLNITGCHTSRIQRDNPVIKTVELLLALFNELGFKATIAITRDIQLYFAVN